MSTPTLDRPPGPVKEPTTRPPLSRSTDDRVVAGVAGGIGQHLGVDPLLLRIGFVLLAISGVGLLAYLVAWIVMPESGTVPQDAGTRTARVAGLGLVALGVILLTQRMVPELSFSDLAPALVIALGLLLAFSSGGRR
jgi:phage shock protein PspC (stress-responsive transcriptional regulator)